MIRFGVACILLVLSSPILAKSIFDETAAETPGSEPADAVVSGAAKAAVPDKKAQDAAALLVHQRYKREFADTAPARRADLCNKLLAQAPATKDPAERYALLRESASVAASNGDILAADLAVDDIAANFQTDAHEERLAAYRVLAAVPAMRPAVDQACITAAETAIHESRFDSADQFLQMTRKPPSSKIASQVAALRQEMSTRKVQGAKPPAALPSTPIVANLPATKSSSPATVSYVCDGSGSMMGQPFDLLKAELTKTIDDLEATQSFNICFFQRSGVTAFSETALTAATPANKAKAIAWLKPIYVASDSDPSAALKLALKQRPQVIYLLTDGAFNKNDEVIRLIAKMNAGKRTRVNTIQFFNRDNPQNERQACEDELRAISKQSGGWFRAVATN